MSSGRARWHAVSHRVSGETGSTGARTAPMDQDPLALDQETMRRIGYQTVDWLVDPAARRGDEPVLGKGFPADMARRTPAGAPRRGAPFEEILTELQDVLGYRSRIDHPR